MTCARENSMYGKGSDFYDENARFCQPCSVNGSTISAYRFCVICQGYLCQKCSTHHKALTVTQNHTLINIEEAKKTLSAAPKDKCSHKCSAHKDKCIKYFCENHSYLGCSVCVTVDHKQCKDVEYIPTVATDVKSNDGFRKFKESLQSLEDLFKASIADVEQKMKAVETDELQLKVAIDEFRQQLIDVLDKLEHDLTRKANSIKKEEARKLSILSTNLSLPMAKVNGLMKQLEMLLAKGNRCDAYVTTKQEAKQLDSYKKQFIDVVKDQSFKRFKFQPNKDALRVSALGTAGSLTEAVFSSEATVSLLRAHTDGSSIAPLPTLPFGAKVCKGKDWAWGDQDSNGFGTVLCEAGAGWYKVKWDRGYMTNRYRYGAEGAYDLQLA